MVSTAYTRGCGSESRSTPCLVRVGKESRCDTVRSVTFISSFIYLSFLPYHIFNIANVFRGQGAATVGKAGVHTGAGTSVAVGMVW